MATNAVLYLWAVAPPTFFHRYLASRWRRSRWLVRASSALGRNPVASRAYLALLRSLGRTMGHRLDLPLLIGLRSRMATFATHPILAGSSGGWVASQPRIFQPIPTPSRHAAHANVVTQPVAGPNAWRTQRSVQSVSKGWKPVKPHSASNFAQWEVEALENKSPPSSCSLLLRGALQSIACRTGVYQHRVYQPHSVYGV
jgi:hypothetical protein